MQSIRKAKTKGRIALRSHDSELMDADDKLQSMIRGEGHNPDIFLINCPYWDVRWPPHGMAYLIEYLKGRGFKTSFLDLALLLYNNPSLFFSHSPTDKEIIEYKTWWDVNAFSKWTNEEFVGRFDHVLEIAADLVVRTRPKTVGFSVAFDRKLSCLAVAEKIRQRSPETPIIFGGYDCLYADQLPYYSDIPDYYVVGEGEIVAENLLTALLKEQLFNRIYEVQGVMVNNGRGHTSFRPAPPPQDLDAIPFPKYQDIHIDDYTVKGSKFVWIGATRGCRWGRCAFCSYPGEFRARSPENVVEEVAYLHERHGVKRIAFSDQDVNNDIDQLTEICRMLHKKGLSRKISLYGQFRADPRADRAFFKMMRETGFWLIDIGLESGCNKTLRSMKKGVSRELVGRNMKAAKEEGLLVGVNIIVGFPGETYSDFVETLKWLIEIRPYLDRIGNVTGAIVMMGSYLFEHLDDYGVVSRIKSDSGVEGYRLDTDHDWRSSLDPKNTRRNRDLRSEIVRRMAIPYGIDVGNPGSSQILNIGEMDEPERELWQFVEKSLSIKLDPKPPKSVNRGLARRTYYLFRRTGLKRTIKTLWTLGPLVAGGRLWV